MGSRSAKAWVSLSPRQRLSGPACPPAQRSLQCQPTTSDLLQPEHLHLQPEDAPGPRGGTRPECGQQTCLEASTPGCDLGQGEMSARDPPPAPSGRTAPTLRCVPCGPPGGAQGSPTHRSPSPSRFHPSLCFLYREDLYRKPFTSGGTQTRSILHALK